MPSDANGNFSLVPSYFVQNGDTVLPVQHNPPLEDIANGLTNRIMRDGRTVMTGNLQMGGNKVTNIAPGTNNGDSVTVEQVGARFSFKTVADLLADTRLGYSSAEVVVDAGDIIEAQGFRYEVAASDAVDAHVETAGGVKLYVVLENGAASILAFGAVDDGDEVGDPGTDNTALLVPSLQAIKNVGGDTLIVPPRCQANWMTVEEDAVPNTRIIDCSGYDYTYTYTPYQMNVVIIQFTALSGGGTVGHAYNGQVFRLSGHYHVASVVESLRAPGTGGSKASYIFYSEGRPDWQIAYDRTIENEETFQFASYGSEPTTTVLSIGGQESSHFKQWMFNGSSAVTDASYVYYQAGRTSDADWLTRGLRSYYRLPIGSTGDINEIYELGTSGTLGRNIIKNDGSRSIWGGSNSGIEISPTGGVGFKKEVLLPTSSITLTASQSGRLVSNVDATGGVGVSLLANTGTIGASYEFYVGAAQQLHIFPGATGSFVGGGGTGIGMRSSTVGSWCEVTCIKAGVWVFRRSGTWSDT